MKISFVLARIFYRKRDRIFPINSYPYNDDSNVEEINDNSSVRYDIKETYNEVSYSNDEFIEPEDIIDDIITPVSN